MKQKSMRFKHIIQIKNELLSILDNNQEIKRLCCYLSDTPLSYTAIVDGQRIKQPDITKSLMNENLIPYGFDDKLLLNQKVYIFCNLNRISFTSKNNMDNNLFILTIFVPIDFNILEFYGDERIIAIASRIADELDDTSLDKGMCNLKINGACNYGRYDKKDYLVLTIPIEILTSSGKEILNN